MNCYIQLKDDKYIDIGNFKKISYLDFEGTKKEITFASIEDFTIATGTLYKFIGDSTALVYGSDILYVHFQ